MGAKILVLGAGELGESILQALAAHPSKPHTSVLLRPSDSPTRSPLLSRLSSLGISIVSGDLRAPLTALASLLKGYDIVISATGFAAGPGIQLHIAKAALQAGVPWFLPWQFGVDYDIIGRGSSQPLFDEQLEVRTLLRGQSPTATKWTIISTGIFTSFLFDPAFAVVDLHPEDSTAIVTALGRWENQITMTSAEDIGTLTADIVLSGQVTDSGVIYIAGDTTTFDGLVNALQEAEWEVKKEILTVEELETERKEKPDNVGPKYQLIWAKNKGVSWPLEKTWNGQRGLQVENMRQWMQRCLPKPKQV